MKKISVSVLPLFFLTLLTSFKPMPTEYLSIKDFIFQNNKYNLSWSIKNKNHYKQEYLRTNDTLTNFNKMIFVDVLLTETNIKEFVSAKMQEIEKRKGSDPVANYQVIENEQTGEFLLDFLISKGDLFEWNAYRYKTINTNKGKAILLFVYSFRSFEGADLRLDDFFPYLKKNRMDLINNIANFKLPSVIIKD
jgi:hypothetical protein